jgi:hypothetical protein
MGLIWRGTWDGARDWVALIDLRERRPRGGMSTMMVIEPGRSRAVPKSTDRLRKYKLHVSSSFSSSTTEDPIVLFSFQ